MMKRMKSFKLATAQKEKGGKKYGVVADRRPA